MTPRTFYNLLDDAVNSGTIDEPAYVGYAHFDSKQADAPTLVAKNGITYLLSDITVYSGQVQFLFVPAGHKDIPIDIAKRPLSVVEIMDKLRTLLPMIDDQDAEIQTNLGAIALDGFDFATVNFTDYIVLYDC